MKKTLLTHLIILNTFLLNAQYQDTSFHRYIGLGIRSSVFQISELPNSIIPPNRLLLNTDPWTYARIEGQFAMYRNEREFGFPTFANPSNTLKLKENSTAFGLGLFGLYPVEKIKFIGGFRYGVNKYVMDNIDTDIYGNPYVVVDKGTITSVSVILGGEYYFSKWFSVGCEFGLVRMNDTLDPADVNSPNTTSTTSITESALIFRFYPY